MTKQDIITAYKCLQREINLFKQTKKGLQSKNAVLSSDWDDLETLMNVAYTLITYYADKKGIDLSA